MFGQCTPMFFIARFGKIRAHAEKVLRNWIMTFDIENVITKATTSLKTRIFYHQKWGNYPYSV